jgi:hypothetical protein
LTVLVWVRVEVDDSDEDGATIADEDGLVLVTRTTEDSDGVADVLGVVVGVSTEGVGVSDEDGSGGGVDGSGDEEGDGGADEDGGGLLLDEGGGLSDDCWGGGADDC